jgi:hypothetical protein
MLHIETAVTMRSLIFLLYRIDAGVLRPMAEPREKLPELFRRPFRPYLDITVSRIPHPSVYA